MHLGASKMSDYMVVATFKPGTDMTQVMALVEEEKAAVKQLQDAGRIGKIYLAVPKGKVFIETLDTDDDGAHAAVSELPMSVFWDLEVFPLSGRA
jgi:muconolactone delta-isomerase